jgi:hypothetical protein
MPAIDSYRLARANDALVLLAVGAAAVGTLAPRTSRRPEFTPDSLPAT